MRFSPGDIYYFLQVVRHGHVGRAAQAAGVTQPAISKAIRRLEDAVGVPLFERGAHGARLTSGGQLFLESARRFDAQHSEMVRSASELRAQHSGLLRVGLTNPATDSSMVQVLSEMVRRRPGLRLVLSIGMSDTLNEKVEKGELDVAVVPSYPGVSLSCSQIELSEDTARVAAREKHPLFKLSSPTLDDLKDYSWAMGSRQSASRRLVFQIFERAGAALPRVALEVSYVSEAVMGLVSSTDLLAVVPASVLRRWFGRVNALPLSVLDVRRTLVLLARPQASWSPLMGEFRDLLLSHRVLPAAASH
jgi:DNA-binding transcriptional LysR family regulator